MIIILTSNNNSKLINDLPSFSVSRWSRNGADLSFCGFKVVEEGCLQSRLEMGHRLDTLSRCDSFDEVCRAKEVKPEVTVVIKRELW